MCVNSRDERNTWKLFCVKNAVLPVQRAKQRVVNVFRCVVVSRGTRCSHLFPALCFRYVAADLKPLGWLWGLVCEFRTGCRQSPATIARTFEPGSGGRCWRRRGRLEGRFARRDSIARRLQLRGLGARWGTHSPRFARRCVTARDLLWCSGPQLLSDQEELRRPRHVRGGARSRGMPRARRRPQSSPKPEILKPQAT